VTGVTRPGAFGHGRRLLRLVPIEDAFGAVELARHVIGVVVDLPGRAPQRVVGDVRSKHAPLDAGGLDDVPDRLIVPVEVVREPDEIEAGLAGRFRPGGTVRGDRLAHRASMDVVLARDGRTEDRVVIPT
jgi:hypothetical protein